jgi:hypothetical protein
LSLLACGESSRHGDSSQGGAAGTGGSSGNAGNAGTGAAGGSGPTGGSAGTAGELVPYFEPGTRLKPRVLALGDGPSIIEGSSSSLWYDAELELDCAFFLDEQGIERCFPRRSQTLLYLDASCTRPVLAAGLDPCHDPPSGYVRSGVGACAHRGFRIGAEVPSSSPLFSLFDGTCAASTSTELGALHELEPVPADTFVGMRRSERARAPGLDAYVREGDDGSWEILGYFDAARDASCFESPVDWSPKSKCIPSFVSATGRFADSTCERPVADASLSACAAEKPTAILTVEGDRDACPAAYTFGLHDIQGTGDITPFQVDASGPCVEGTTTPTAFYLPSESIDLSTLPTLEALVVGTGAVRAAFSAFGSVPYLPLQRGAGPLMDASGSPCLAWGAPDATVRCVPASSAAANRQAFLYEDASCSAAPVVAWSARPTCPADPPLPSVVLILDPPVGCSQGFDFSEAFEVLGKSTSSTFYAKDSTDACGPAEPVSPAVTFLKLSSAVAPAAFPEIERTLGD